MAAEEPVRPRVAQATLTFSVALGLLVLMVDMKHIGVSENWGYLI